MASGTDTPMVTAKTPVTMLSGFLGAGALSILQSVIEEHAQNGSMSPLPSVYVSTPDVCVFLLHQARPLC